MPTRIRLFSLEMEKIRYSIALNNMHRPINFYTWKDGYLVKTTRRWDSIEQ